MQQQIIPEAELEILIFLFFSQIKTTSTTTSEQHI